jgi:hypothetical protein
VILFRNTTYGGNSDSRNTGIKTNDGGYMLFLGKAVLLMF